MSYFGYVPVYIRSSVFVNMLFFHEGIRADFMAKAGLESCVNNYFSIAGSGHNLPFLAQASWEKRE